MTEALAQKTDNALLPAGNGGKERVCVYLLPIFVCFLMCPAAHAAASLVLQAAPAGVSLTAAGGNYQSSFGTLNALGIPPASPTVGVTILPLSDGALYYTTYQLEVTGGLPAGHKATVTGYVSTNFSNPAALIMQSCPSNQTCNSSASFSTCQWAAERST